MTPLLNTPTPEGHTEHSDCWCHPTIAQYQDEQSGRWWTRIVHDAARAVRFGHRPYVRWGSESAPWHVRIGVEPSLEMRCGRRAPSGVSPEMPYFAQGYNVPIERVCAECYANLKEPKQ